MVWRVLHLPDTTLYFIWAGTDTGCVVGQRRKGPKDPQWMKLTAAPRNWTLLSQARPIPKVRENKIRTLIMKLYKSFMHRGLYFSISSPSQNIYTSEFNSNPSFSLLKQCITCFLLTSLTLFSPVLFFSPALCTPPSSSHHGEPSFQLVWNSLPPDFIYIDFLPRFKSSLKTPLFKSAFSLGFVSSLLLVDLI